MDERYWDNTVALFRCFCPSAYRNSCISMRSSFVLHPICNKSSKLLERDEEKAIKRDKEEKSDHNRMIKHSQTTNLIAFKLASNLQIMHTFSNQPEQMTLLIGSACTISFVTQQSNKQSQRHCVCYCCCLFSGVFFEWFLQMFRCNKCKVNHNGK